MSNKLKNKAASDGTAKLYLNDKLADVHFIFKVNDKIEKVPANKTRLAVLSPVFYTMFFGSITEGAEVEIVDASANAFKEFLQFFYLDEVTLSIENVETIIRLADKYDVLEHVKACAKFLKNHLNVNNICWGYQVAIYLKNQEMINFCAEEISRSPKEIFASTGFKQCEQETLQNILKLNLTCNETDIFEACLNWAKYGCKQLELDENMENLKYELGDCLKLIRFGEMTHEEFTQIAMSYKELFTLEEFQDIIFTISTKGKHKSKIFEQNPRKYIWNSNKILKCERTTESNETRIMVGNTETTLFSSNTPVLLGEFSTQTLNNEKNQNLLEMYHSSNAQYQMPHSISSYDPLLYNSNVYQCNNASMNCSVEVTISMVSDDSFNSKDASTILHKGHYSTWRNDRLTVNLPEPIFVKPKNVYQIRLSSIFLNRKYNSTYRPEVECADGIKIRFHQNQDCSSNNFISTLGLNKL